VVKYCSVLRNCEATRVERMSKGKATNQWDNYWKQACIYFPSLMFCFGSMYLVHLRFRN